MMIVFHGDNAASFTDGFSALVGPGHTVTLLPDVLESASDQAAYTAADVIIGVGFSTALPRPEGLKLFHVPGAGYDAVDLAALPPATTVPTKVHTKASSTRKKRACASRFSTHRPKKILRKVTQKSRKPKTERGGQA